MREFNCLMVDVPIPKWNKWSSLIKPQHLYHGNDRTRYGLESEPHVTILYGLHPEVTLEDIQGINLPDLSKIPIHIHGIDRFDQEEYDVLKFKVRSPILGKINELLKSKFPYTNSYNIYNPHITIAYLKAGYGIPYMQKYKRAGSFKIYPSSYVYSMVNGHKYKFK